MMRNFQDVYNLHLQFDLPRGDESSGGTAVEYALGTLPHDIIAFRIKFLLEELDEFKQAAAQGDIVAVVDSLIDLAYVTYGTVLFMGLNPRKIEELESGGLRLAHGDFKHISQFIGMTLRASSSEIKVSRVLSSRVNVGFASSMEVCINNFKQFHWLPASALRDHLILHQLWMLVFECYRVAALMNVPWDECWEQVHKANSLKVRCSPDGKDSKRGSAYDLMKPKGWIAPEGMIETILVQHGAAL